MTLRSAATLEVAKVTETGQIELGAQSGPGEHRRATCCATGAAWQSVVKFERRK